MKTKSASRKALKIIDGVEYKQCTHKRGCGEWLPLDQDFRLIKDHYDSACIDCRNRINRENYAIKNGTTMSLCNLPIDQQIAFFVLPPPPWSANTNSRTITGMFGYNGARHETNSN